MLDNLQVICWTIVYVFAVIFGIKHREDFRPQIPVIAVCMNFAWEINAIIFTNGSFWGHYLWLLLDAVIFMIMVVKLWHKRGYLLILLTAVLAIILRVLFVHGFMLVSCFIIDILMAVEFAVNIKRISPYGKLSIAVFKLFGDLFAWLYYMEFSVTVKLIGAVVLILNSFYLFICIRSRIKDSISAIDELL